jgi:hypothetical protein
VWQVPSHRRGRSTLQAAARLCDVESCLVVQTSAMPQEPRPSPPLETWLGDTLDGVACVVAVGLVAVELAGGQGIPRILLALSFLAYVPGRAITANWAQLTLRPQVAMAMLFSLVIVALLATVTLWAHYWHPIGLMQAEAGLSLLGLTVAVVRRHRPGSRRLRTDGAPGW